MTTAERSQQKGEGNLRPFLYRHPVIGNNGMLEEWNNVNVKEYFSLTQYSSIPLFHFPSRRRHVEVF